jgi:hypothetical protein
MIGAGDDGEYIERPHAARHMRLPEVSGGHQLGGQPQSLPRTLKDPSKVN